MTDTTNDQAGTLKQTGDLEGWPQERQTIITNYLLPNEWLDAYEWYVGQLIQEAPTEMQGLLKEGLLTTAAFHRGSAHCEFEKIRCAYQEALLQKQLEQVKQQG